MKRSRLVRSWLPVGLRIVAILIVVPPALAKFFRYETEVAYFETWGVPFPAVAVVVSGAIELLAVISFLFGAAGRFAAAGLATVMVVAMLTAGVTAPNVIVLIVAIGILVLGTGRLSLWMPAETLMNE